jgi:hypothetical protein
LDYTQFIITGRKTVEQRDKEWDKVDKFMKEAATRELEKRFGNGDKLIKDLTK